MSKIEMKEIEERYNDCAGEICRDIERIKEYKEELDLIAERVNFVLEECENKLKTNKERLKEAKCRIENNRDFYFWKGFESGLYRSSLKGLLMRSIQNLEAVSRIFRYKF